MSGNGNVWQNLIERQLQRTAENIHVDVLEFRIQQVWDSVESLPIGLHPELHQIYD